MSCAGTDALRRRRADREHEAKPEPKPAPKPAPKLVPKPVVKVDPDSDGDGVPDSRDDCPDTTPGTPVDARGCPEIPDLKGVHFEFDKAALTSEARGIMDAAAATLKRYPHVRVEVVGHTDSVGSDAYNQKLSEQRADAVRSYLEAAGVSGSRIAATGRGESAPIASNDSSEGRQQNRRVEVTARPIK